ncbi:hypothetical protein CSPX01_02423 [Colletotrichum filicis]|nr:hypothetical protein CSPX01_02423 [Colletotrichum filicis]
MASCKWTGRNLGTEWKARLGAGRRAGAEQKNSCDLQKTDCVTDWEWWRRGVFGGGGCSVTVGSGGGGGGGGRRWRRGVTGRASQTVNDAPALGPLTAQTYTGHRIVGLKDGSQQHSSQHSNPAGSTSLPLQLPSKVRSRVTVVPFFHVSRQAFEESPPIVFEWTDINTYPS